MSRSIILVVLLALMLSACGGAWDGSAQVAPTPTRVPPTATATAEPAAPTPTTGPAAKPSAPSGDLTKLGCDWNRPVNIAQSVAQNKCVYGDTAQPAAAPAAPSSSGSTVAPTPAPSSSGLTIDVSVLATPLPVPPRTTPVIVQPITAGPAQRIDMGGNVWNEQQLDLAQLPALAADEIYVVRGDAAMPKDAQYRRQCVVYAFNSVDAMKSAKMWAGTWNLYLVRGGDAKNREEVAENLREDGVRAHGRCTRLQP